MSGRRVSDMLDYIKDKVQSYQKKRESKKVIKSLLRGVKKASPEQLVQGGSGAGRARFI